MRTLKNFNKELWSNLLQYEKDMKISMTPITVKDIQDTFSIGKGVAEKYYTLLMYKDHIAGSIESDIALRKLTKDITEAKTKEKKLSDTVEELFETLNTVYETAIDPKRIRKIHPEIYEIKRASEIGIFSVLSDAHVEEEVRPEAVLFKNEYNLDIARERILTYFITLLNRGMQFHTLDDLVEPYKRAQLVIHLAGDFITGWIHPEGVEVNSLNPTEAIIFAEDNLISGIDLLAESGAFSDITLVCTTGNHARTTDKKRYATGYKNSFEWLMYRNIKKHVERTHSNVKVVIAEGQFVVVDFIGKKICCSHGDHFKYAGGIGGLLVPAIRWVHKMTQIVDADLFSIGHWHSYMALVDSKLLVNSSVIGPSAFSIGLGFKPEPPKMQYQLIDDLHGFTTNDPIFL